MVGTQTGDVTTSYTMERVGDVLQYRDGVVTTTDTTNDDRVIGTGTYTFNVDAYTVVGREWGTYRLENAGGTWEGPCTGGAYMEDITSIMTCWLVGSGGYAGYTYGNYNARPGGGLAWVKAQGLVRVDGTVSANGGGDQTKSAQATANGGWLGAVTSTCTVFLVLVPWLSVTVSSAT